jgi:hypothetical protein
MARKNSRVRTETMPFIEPIEPPTLSDDVADDVADDSVAVVMGLIDPVPIESPPPDDRHIFHELEGLLAKWERLRPSGTFTHHRTAPARVRMDPLVPTHRVMYDWPTEDGAGRLRVAAGRMRDGTNAVLNDVPERVIV